MKMKLIKVMKKDVNVLTEKKFGEVNVFIKERDGKVYADFTVPLAGASGYLDSVKQGLAEMKKRVKEVESAISWAETEIKKQSK